MVLSIQDKISTPAIYYHHRVLKMTIVMLVNDVWAESPGEEQQQ